MKLKQIVLPKKYQYIEGQSNPLYKKFDGWEKISYSQFTSFKDYKFGYLQDYILKCAKRDGIFALYGGFCGKYFEDSTKSEYLTEFDMQTIDSIEKHSTSKYESEIVIDLELFGLSKTCLQGFSDLEYTSDNKLHIIDLKTGNSDNMLDKYGDMNKYFQTRLYAYQRENEGFEIGTCKVIHLGRKGNNFNVGDKNCLRLNGQIDEIPTPYDTLEVEKYIKESIVSTCIDISEYFSVFNSFFAEKVVE